MARVFVVTMSTGGRPGLAATNVRNTFDAPETVMPVAFDGAALTTNGLGVALPALSVVALELR